MILWAQFNICTGPVQYDVTCFMHKPKSAGHIGFQFSVSMSDGPVEFLRAQFWVLSSSPSECSLQDTSSISPAPIITVLWCPASCIYKPWRTFPAEIVAVMFLLFYLKCFFVSVNWPFNHWKTLRAKHLLLQLLLYSINIYFYQFSAKDSFPAFDDIISCLLWDSNYLFSQRFFFSSISFF